MFSRSMSSTCRQRRLPCQCFPLLCRNLSRLSGVVRPSPSHIKWFLKTSQKCQVTSFCRVFLINALLLPSPRPFDIGASKRAIGLQEYLNIFVASLKCKKEKKPKTHHFLYCGANSMLRRWPDREVITISACWPWKITNASVAIQQMGN